MRGKELKRAFLAYIDWAINEKGHSPKTLANHKDINGRLLRFLGDKELNRESALAYITQQTQWSASTRESATKRIRAFINWLADKDKGHGFTFEKFHLEIPRVHKQLIFVPTVHDLFEDIHAGTETGDGDNIRNARLKSLARVGLVFILESGLRVSELLALESKDFFLESGEYPEFIVHCKGGAVKKQPFPRAMLETIRALILQQSQGKLFPLTSPHLNLCLQRGAMKNKREYKGHCHLLRHAFAVTLLQRGLPMVVVSQLLRHDSVRTTEEYYSNLRTDFLSDQLHSNHPLLQHTMTDDERYRKLIDTLSRAGFGLNTWSEVKTFDKDGWLTIRLKKPS